MSQSSRFAASRPRLAVPPGACDCHTHVFGPAGRYPLRRDRVYTPADALPSDMVSMLATLGMERVVLVQASVYDADLRCMLDGLAALGGRARAVAVIAADTPTAQLEALHAAGVRGVRLNVATARDPSAAPIADRMKALADRIGPLGWHLQVFARAHELPSLLSAVDALGVDVVFDHMGLIPADGFRNHPGFAALLAMLAGGRVWVKASGAYRVGPPDGPWDGVTPLARAIIEARPDRIVWGSDWPHTPPHGRDPVPDDRVNPFRRLDTGRLLDLLADWAPDETVRRHILVDNPARLYHFN